MADYEKQKAGWGVSRSFYEYEQKLELSKFVAGFVGLMVLGQVAFVSQGRLDGFLVCTLLSFLAGGALIFLVARKLEAHMGALMGIYDAGIAGGEMRTSARGRPMRVQGFLPWKNIVSVRPRGLDLADKLGMGIAQRMGWSGPLEICEVEAANGKKNLYLSAPKGHGPLLRQALKNAGQGGLWKEKE